MTLEYLFSGFILVMEVLKLGMQFKLFYIVSLALRLHNANVLLHLILQVIFSNNFALLCSWNKSAYSMCSFLLNDPILDSAFEIFHYSANFDSLSTVSFC